MFKHIYTLGLALFCLYIQPLPAAALFDRPGLSDFSPAEVRTFDLPLWRGDIGPDSLGFYNSEASASPWLPQYLIVGTGPEFQEQSVIDFQLFKAEFTGEIMLDSNGFFEKSAVSGGIVMYSAETMDQIVIMEEMHKFAYTRAFAHPILDSYNAVSTAFVYHEATIYYVIQFATIETVEELNLFVAAARANLEQAAASI